MSRDETTAVLSKVPAITLGFWIAKIFATTLGETAGDTVSMTWNLGYLIGSVIFFAVLILLVAAQIRASYIAQTRAKCFELDLAARRPTARERQTALPSPRAELEPTH